MAQTQQGTISVNDGAIPLDLAATPQVSGGTLATDTYYYVLSAIYPAGESVKSAEVSAVVTGPNGSVDFTWTGIVPLTKYRLYRGTVSGVYTEFYEITAPATSFTDTNASATAGSPLTSSTIAQKVLGSNTLWLANVSVGDKFKVIGDPVLYIIGSISTDTLLTLSNAFAGNTATGASYIIQSDFTTERQYNEILEGDLDWADTLNEGINDIDRDMGKAFGTDKIFNSGVRIVVDGNSEVFLEQHSHSVVTDTVTGVAYALRELGAFDDTGEMIFEPSTPLTHKFVITNEEIFVDDAI